MQIKNNQKQISYINGDPLKNETVITKGAT